MEIAAARAKHVPRNKLTMAHSEHSGHGGRGRVINLAEAYAYRSATSAESRVLSSLQVIYDSSLNANAQELERQFVGSLLGLSGQAVPRNSGSFVFFSASVAISIVGKILARRRMSCAVTDPTLDIIPTLMRSAGVGVVSFPESSLQSPETLVEQVGTDAIYIALPNNPTGVFLDRRVFERLAQACKRTGKTLVVDASFYMLEPRACSGYYEVLDRTGVDYLVIEDTGKLWATNGLKAAVLVASENYVSDAKSFFDELIVTTSPFILTLLYRLITEAGLPAVEEIRRRVRSNRAVLYDALSESRLFSVSEGSAISVECVFYDESVFPDQQRLLSDLKSMGLCVVGSDSMYLADRGHKPFLRIALSRDEGDLREGIRILLQAERDALRRTTSPAEI